VQLAHDIQTDGRCDDPVGARLDRDAGIGINHYRAIRMGVAEWRELLGRTGEIERAGRFQVRHEHAFFGVEDLGRFTHETHAADDQRAAALLMPEPGHLQRVGHASARLLRQVLQVRMDVEMREQSGVLFAQQLPRARLELLPLGGSRLDGRPCPCLSDG
jgi:hypothetical protein